jgi:hypothetical protein
MTRYVIDAPTLLHLVANGVQVNPRHQIVAPNLIRSQALTLLLEAVRNGEVTEAQALQRHERFTELKMRLLGDRGSDPYRPEDRAGSWDDLRRWYLPSWTQADAMITVDPKEPGRTWCAGTAQASPRTWTDPGRTATSVGAGQNIG